jgi:PII-like signaling protein
MNEVTICDDLIVVVEVVDQKEKLLVVVVVVVVVTRAPGVGECSSLILVRPNCWSGSK